MTVKVCGLKFPDNIKAVDRLGVNLIGMIFYPRSKRFVKVNPNVTTHAPKVGVVVNEGVNNVLSLAGQFGLDYIQFHGDEAPEALQEVRNINPNLGIIKAISISSTDDIKRATDYCDVADLLIFDTKTEHYGGSGKKFDWSIIEQYDGDKPFLLSGGISPDDYDVINNFNHSKFAGIDLNSKFEIEPGLKDIDRLKTFLSKIKHFNKD